MSKNWIFQWILVFPFTKFCLLNLFIYLNIFINNIISVELPKYYGTMVYRQGTIIYIISKIVCKLFPCPPSPMAICFVILRYPRGPDYLLGAPMFLIQLKSCRQVDGALRVILWCLEFRLASCNARVIEFWVFSPLEIQ